MISWRDFGIVITFVSLVSLACSSATQIPQPTTISIPIITHQAFANTPRSTMTPISTMMPGVLECANILSEHGGMTDLQWEDYKQTIQGKQIYFSGVVSQVYDDGSVFMNEDCGFTLYKVPRDIAIALKKGQLLEGYGTISNVYYVFVGAMVDININPDLLIVR